MRIFPAFLLAAGALCASSAWAQEPGTATAELKGAKGEAMGTVSFEATPSGMVHVTLDLKDVPAGVHAFHVHETGKCDASDGFKSAGGHYAGGKKHGLMEEDGPHAGDFPNVTVGEDGTAVEEFFTDHLSLAKDGTNPLMDEDGSAVVLHAKNDDYKSQPAGDAGDRIACGVVM